MKTPRAMTGYAKIWDGAGAVAENDFVLCGHCQAMVDITPGKSVSDAGAYCDQCDSVCCPACAKTAHLTGQCIPWEKQIEAEEKNSETLRRLGYDPATMPRGLFIRTL